MLWDAMAGNPSEAAAVAGTPSMGARGRDRHRPLIAVLWLIALALGAMHAWAYRHAMGGDGISYMDVAGTYLRRDWAQIANGYWSPLYSWLLAAALAVFKPLPYWEAAVAHLVNFLIYVFALASFHYLWAGLLRYRRREAAADPGRTESRIASTPLPDWAWFTLGYALFLWASLNLITVRLVTPDLCVAGFIYLLAGLLIRIRVGATRYRTFALLGFIIALGYLTKLILLTVGVVFLAVALLVGGRLRATVPRIALALLVLAAVASPWVVALSMDKGRLTLGESGKMNYAYMINDARPWYHWQGLPPETGTPEHQVRQLLDKPAVFEYAEPVGGSYPVWYDNSYWTEGMRVSFSLQGHLEALRTNSGAYFRLLFHQQAGMVFCIAVLFLLRRNWWSSLKDIARLWFLLVPAFAGLGLYAMISVQPRLVAGFIVLLWAPVLHAVRVPNTPEAKRVTACISVAALLAMLALVGYESVPVVKHTALDLQLRTDTAPHRQWQIADELHEMGLRPGDKVAHVGQALKSWSYWARLAGVKIVAEVRPATSFWVADDAIRAKVMDAFTKAGARAVVTRKLESNDRPFGLPVDFAPGWEPIGRTGHYVYFLTPDARAASRPAD